MSTLSCRPPFGALAVVTFIAAGGFISGCGNSSDGNDNSDGSGGSPNANGTDDGGLAPSAGGSGVGGTGSGADGPGGTGAGGDGIVGAAGTSGVVDCSGDPYEHTFEFGAIFEGWAISTFSTPSLIPVQAASTRFDMPTLLALGDAAVPTLDAAVSIDAGAPTDPVAPMDAGIVMDASTPPAGSMGTVMELDTNEGAPDSPNGALKLTIPFDGPAQLLLLGTIFNTGLNFQNSTVTAKIKLDSGLITSPAETGRAFLVLKATDAFVYHAGPAVVLDPSAGWVTLTIDPDAPSSASVAAGYTPCLIRELDIEIHTGDSGTFQEAVVFVDSVSVTPKAE